MTETKSVIAHEEITQMNKRSWETLDLMIDILPRINGSGKVTLTLHEYEKIVSNTKLLQDALLEITRLRVGLQCIASCDASLQLSAADTAEIAEELAKATLDGKEEKHWAYKTMITDHPVYKELSKE